jgi:L-ascorbate metabolism protein UlaG (beta-lactamase superfamily)
VTARHDSPAMSGKSSGWRRLGKWLAVAAALFVLLALAQGWRSFGQGAEGARLLRMQRSPQWHDGHFVNPQPLVNDWVDMLSGLLAASPHVRPSLPLPVDTHASDRLRSPPASGLRVTWLGHASLLLEIDGHRVLTDPTWSERASPLSWAGPTRWYAPPVPLAALPPIDAVVISHDHYDHLDHATIVALRSRVKLFVVPLGVGAHLAYWGVPEAQIRELDWWERTRVGTLDIVCTPARHASGRTLFDKDATLWASYALLGPTHRAFFSGDTGLFPALRDIGERFGPFDVTLIETGQYHRAWPDWHIGPEQAVTAHTMLRGKLMIPIHWTLFSLAYHGWTEPAERTVVAARRAGVALVVARPGESIEPASPPALVEWWPELPWQTAEEHPIVSGNVGPRAAPASQN